MTLDGCDIGGPRLRAVFLFLLLLAPEGSPEELIIGGEGLSWVAAREEAEFLSVDRDSIWLWDANPGQNIAPLALRRGSGIFAVEERVTGFGQNFRTVVGVEGLERLLDGDPHTAFDPDAGGVARRLEVYVDLGGYFEVDEIRFFPRLDSGHRDRFLQSFELGFNRTARSVYGDERDVFEAPFNVLINAHTQQPNDQSVVLWPRPGEIAVPRVMRYVRIKTLDDRPWEVAELEIRASGAVPSAEYVSRPLTVPGGFPVWGRLRYEGGDIAELPVVVQTRTGPDHESVQYFLRLTKSKSLRKVTRQGWENIVTMSDVERGEAVQGPVLPNPAWSAWETVTGGLILSPTPQEYIQFRVQLTEPGITLRQLIFEYTDWPLAQVLLAEIDPARTEAGQETEFILSLQVQRLVDNAIPTSGFRRLELLTPAEIAGVDRVLVDDREVYHTVRRNPGQGFSIEFWERIRAGGSFVQIFFRGRVFTDGTPFRVQALDERSTGAETETVYQFARAGDVDPRTPGGSLVVRLEGSDQPLISRPEPRTHTFSPNGDGINDFFELEYSLLKLTRAAPVRFEIFDLAGRRVRQGYAGADASGRFVRIWDGRDRVGRLLLPGTYVYRVEVRADVEVVTRQGLVCLAY